MPLCPQITNTPITVTQTADFTVSSVLPVVAATTTQLDAVAAEVAAADAAAAAAVVTANAAAATAGAAQTTANAALADAAVAYAEAIGSLQPSASTIVNASNQMTAIAANGITVYSGSSASSGARVVLNSTGLAGFNSGGSATFSISASTGAAVFSGSVTGSTITGGTLNIAGNAIINASGLLTATGATITGTINATAGYFGTASNGFSISSTGLVGVGTGTIVGGAISGTTFTNGSTFSVTSAGVLTATSGTIGGFTLSASSIYSSTNLVIETTGQISGGNSSTIFYGFANIGGGAATGERLIVAGDSVFNGKISTITSSFVGQMNYSGIATGSGSTMVVVTTGSRVAYTTSSERFKEQIQYINTTGWLDKVLAMQPITYKTSEDFTVEGEPNETQIGFLAEDIYDIGGGLEKAVVLDPLGDPFSLSYDRLTVFLTLAIKELKAEINQLKGE
jgi:hypothetical protein